MWGWGMHLTCSGAPLFRKLWREIRQWQFFAREIIWIMVIHNTMISCCKNKISEWSQKDFVKDELPFMKVRFVMYGSQHYSWNGWRRWKYNKRHTNGNYHIKWYSPELQRTSLSALSITSTPACRFLLKFVGSHFECDLNDVPESRNYMPIIVLHGYSRLFRCFSEIKQISHFINGLFFEFTLQLRQRPISSSHVTACFHEIYPTDTG